MEGGWLEEGSLNHTRELCAEDQCCRTPSVWTHPHVLLLVPWLDMRWAALNMALIYLC